MSRTAEGERICRRITRTHARTFYFASSCLPRRTRTHAYAVYGFCRWADDGVDEAADLDQAVARLQRARRALDRAYGDGGLPPALAAFRRTVRDRAIPRDLFDSLLDGMAMDLTVSRYPDGPALDLYCYRAAGVVGLMMAHIFGFHNERCLPRAVALGHAMQLTNILRDVGEDLGKGRVYLPQDAMARFGLTDDDLVAGRVDDRFRGLIREQIAQARGLYREAEAGIPDLIGESSRLTVRVMGRLYGGILGAIEELDYDVFRNRAHVTTRRKLATMAACLVESGQRGFGQSWRSPPMIE